MFQESQCQQAIIQEQSFLQQNELPQEPPVSESQDAMPLSISLCLSLSLSLSLFLFLFVSLSLSLLFPLSIDL